MTSSPDTPSFNVPKTVPPMPRDLMAPDTEPTDEELHAVMVAARDAAMERKKCADAWTAARLVEATAVIAADRERRRGQGRGSGG